MTVTFGDFFRSFYYSNTYVQPVDLSDQALSQHLLENENREAAKKAQQLISSPKVRAVLSEPLSYDPEEMKRKNKVLQDRGFTLLSSKPLIGNGAVQTIPFYSVVEHGELPGWVIKSGATRIAEDQLVLGPINDQNEMAFFTQEESILRIEMAKRVAKVAKEANIDVVIPKKKLVAYSNSENINDVTKKYCVVCEKVKVLSVRGTVQTIKSMDAKRQKEVAQKIVTIVEKAGLVDASFDNIRLTPEGKLAFLDTEPAGLMISKKPGLWNTFFGKSGASVEKCARIGLYSLNCQTTKAGRGTAANIFEGSQVEPGLESFNKHFVSAYENASSPSLSKWKISLSILSLGLIPLVNIIVALVKSHLANQTFEKLRKMDGDHFQKVQKFISKEMGNISICSMPSSPDELTKIQKKLTAATQKLQKQEFQKEYQKKRTPIAKQFFAYVEGVPFSGKGSVTFTS